MVTNVVNEINMHPSNEFSSMFMSISPGTIDGTCWYVEDAHWNIGHVAVVGLPAAATSTAGVDVCLVISDYNNKLLAFPGPAQLPYRYQGCDDCCCRVLLVEVVHAHTTTHFMQSTHSIIPQTTIVHRVSDISSKPIAVLTLYKV